MTCPLCLKLSGQEICRGEVGRENKVSKRGGGQDTKNLFGKTATGIMGPQRDCII